MKIGIIGLGLIGGSLAKALKKRFDAGEIVAVNRSMDVLTEAYSEGVIDGYDTEVSHIFTGCRVVFICTPVDKICYYIKKLTPFIDESCIVTDVGSTKEGVCREAAKIGGGVCFLGGHPMTGSEMTRYTFSKEYLFENSYYIFTPYDNTPRDKIDFMKQMASAIGAIPIVMPADIHDHVMSYISHVPHVAAAALVNTAQRAGKEAEDYIYKLAAGGFKDITRIASSNPEIWQSISFENKNEIIKGLDILLDGIAAFKTALLNNEFEEVYQFFQSAKTFRDGFTGQATAGAGVYEIKIDILDTPGIIAEILAVLSQNGVSIKNIGIAGSREYEGGILRIVFDNEKEKAKSAAILKDLNYEVH